LAETQAYQQSVSGSAPLLQQTLAGKHFGWVAVAVGGILGLGVLVILAMRRLRKA